MITIKRANDQHGKRIFVYLTACEIDRLVEARDQYRRGYPVKG